MAAGTGYRVALYWGLQGTPESELTQVGNSVGFLTGSAAGTFTGGTRTLTPLLRNGDVVTVQARGWTVLPDVGNSYEAVLAAALAGDARAAVGKNPLFDHKSVDRTISQELAVAMGGPIANGGNPYWQGFAITPVPEPSTITLVALASTALLFFRLGRKTQ